MKRALLLWLALLGFLPVGPVAWGQTPLSERTETTTPAAGDYTWWLDADSPTVLRKISWANLFKSPTLVTPVLGVATATSVNGLTITTTTGTVTITNGKTLSVSNTLTLTGTDGSTLAIGTGGTLGTAAFTAATAYAPAAGSTSVTTLGTIATGTWNGSVIAPAFLGTGSSITTKYLRGDGTWQTISGGGDALTSGNLSQFAATTSLQLAGVITNETGSGALVFGTSPTMSDPTFTGTTTIDTLNVTTFTAGSFLFEGATADAFETTLTVVDPTADNVVSLPNATDTLVGKATTDTLTNKTLTAPVLGGTVTGTYTLGGTPTFPSSVSLDTEWDTAAEINAATTDDDFATLTGRQTVAGKNVSHSAALASDDTFDGTSIPGLNNSGGVTQWDAVYLNGSSAWVAADANGSGTFPCRGLATATASNGAATDVVTRGTVRNDAWTWTPGGAVYLSTTAAGLTQTAPSTSGDKVQVVGFALTADILFVNITGEYLTIE